MSSKRVFSDISNTNVKNGFNGNNNDKTGQKSPKSVKRALDLSPNKSSEKCLKKKDKSIAEQKTNRANDENESFDANETQTSDPTLTVVKALDISSKADTSSPKCELTHIDEKVSQTSDLSFEANTIDFGDPNTYYCPPNGIPDSIEDFDRTQMKNIESEPNYAFDIFKYYKEKEQKVITKKYIEIQPELSRGMRSVLVDWMVEVQESFELNPETLYLSVKIIDQFLMREKITKLEFQLLGATSLLIAAKLEETCPPIKDFVYICDGAYTRSDILLMERRILKALSFDMCYPISYRFLRRYARCAKLSAETLNLAQFVLEMSLMEYEIIEEADSRVAAAALLLALRKNGTYEWSETLEFYSGYKEDELTILMYRLNHIICTQTKTKAIRTKYSIMAKTLPLPPTKVTKFLMV